MFQTKPSRLRFLVFSITTLLMVSIWVRGYVVEPLPELRASDLTQAFGIYSVILLYFTLLITPLTRFITPSQWTPILVAIRRPLGVVSFLAALLHSWYGFFVELGGFKGIPYWNAGYPAAVIEGAVALLILVVLAATSVDAAASWLGSARWKLLHRFVYLAAFLIVIHTLVLGSHFTTTGSIYLRIGFVAISFLLFLEALRFDKYLERTGYFRITGIGLTTMLMTGFIASSILSFENPTSSLNLHSAHEAAASTVVAPVHYHANFQLYLNDQLFDFNQAKYMEPVSVCSITADQQVPVDRVHMHNEIGNLVHIHATQVTWSDFFTNLGFALGDTSIVTDTGMAYLDNSADHLVFILNGQAVPDVADRYIQPNDRLLINYGTETAAQLSARYANVPATAAAASATQDPATCSGS